MFNQLFHTPQSKEILGSFQKYIRPIARIFRPTGNLCYLRDEIPIYWKMNKPVRCLAVDDEPLALEILAGYIDQVSELTLVASLNNPNEVLSFIERGEVDLVFLDVQMPGITGVELAKAIAGRCEVIFTTAFPEYALEGYEWNVADYLLKPISFERFQKAVGKVLEKFAFNGKQDFFFVKTTNRLQKVAFDDIVFIEGLKDYVSIYTRNERLVSLLVLKHVENFLPSARFARVHRSFIVALDKISSIEKSRIYIQDRVIPIGETYKDDFFKRIEERNSF